jgi:hypothetical protein
MSERKNVMDLLDDHEWLLSMHAGARLLGRPVIDHVAKSIDWQVYMFPKKAGVIGEFIDRIRAYE